MNKTLRWPLLALLALLLGQVRAAEVLIDFNAMNLPTSSQDSHDGDIIETWTYTQDGITVSVSPAAEGVNNANRFWGTNGGPQLRCYSGSFTISSDEAMSHIVFNATKLDVTPSAGAVNGKEWTGDATQVVFTVNANTQINSITVTTGGGGEEPPLPQPDEDILNVTFLTDFGGFTVDEGQLPQGIDHVWVQDPQYGAKASAYVEGVRYATEAWLISPEVDLSNYKNVTLAFEHTGKYFSNMQQEAVLKARASGGEWQVVTIPTYMTGQDWKFVEAVVDLSAFEGKKMQFAFIYTSTEQSAATWEVKNLKVTGEKATPQVETPWRDIEVNLTGSLVNNDEKVEGTNIRFGVIINEDGTQQRVAADDPGANIVVDGIWHDDSHGWTKTTATVKVPGDVKIGIGNCQYGSATVTVKNANGEEVLAFNVPAENNCWHQDRVNNITYGTYSGGATTLTIYNATYMPFISVQAVKTDLENEAVTATFPYNLGTPDQKANFGEAEEFFLTSKVTLGSNLNYFGSRAHNDITLTQINPTEQQSAPDESNAIKFLIRPYPGLTFTPSKVTLKANRWGTDGGKIDIAWVSPNGDKLVLAEGETPNRNNNGEGPSVYSFELSGATAGEGECGLQLNLYSLANNKQYGFADIVIEGTLNGKKQEIPILSSFVANGVTYDVEKTFAISGDDYVATIELSKKETMISAANPVSDVVAKEGTVGTIIYEGDNTGCVVTIPVTHNNITMKWVANFVQKPDFTLTYYDVDGTTVLGTQTIEKDAPIEQFDVDASKVTVAEGSAFRGWAAALSGSGNRKYKIGDAFTENTNLFALVTRIEQATTTARYDYDLTDMYFDPADHEMLDMEGSGYWHDKQHGWAFAGGDKVKLTMAGKGYVKIGLCQYSASGDLTLTAPDGSTVVGSVSAKASSDGASTTLQYDGAQGGGELTLTFPSGATYIHNISIVNMSDNPYTQVEGTNLYIVKLGETDTENGSNLLTMLELANGLQGTDRQVIFLPDATYDLGETVLTTISRSNLSLVGQSMEGTIIKNAPDRAIEGIGTTATILNTSSNLYLQDLTLQNALDYYGAGAAGQVGGRAVCLQDKGQRTISKNVRMLSYQDTYYSNSNSQFYWETSELHGCVDFLCGGGDVFYDRCLLVAESRSATGKSGEATLTAPYIDASNHYGYVFNQCTVENKAAKFNFGRAWGGVSRLAFLNTTLNQPTEISATRFTPQGMNVVADRFVEYRSVDPEGNVVSPESNIVKFVKDKDVNEMETILTAEQAAEYTIDKVFTNWTPQEATVQAVVNNLKVEGGVVTWEASSDATLFAIFVDNHLKAVTTDRSYNVSGIDGNITVRAANAMGGFGIAYDPTGIELVEVSGDDVVNTTYYSIDGMRTSESARGIIIRVQTLKSGKTVTTKLVK